MWCMSFTWKPAERQAAQERRYQVSYRYYPRALPAAAVCCGLKAAGGRGPENYFFSSSPFINVRAWVLCPGLGKLSETKM